MRAILPLLAMSLALVAAACQTGGPALSGRIAWAKDGDLWVMDLPSKQDRKLTRLPSSATVIGAAWSPDGKRVAWAQFGRRPNESGSGSDIYVANADGGDARILVERDAPRTLLEAPTWASSGKVYYSGRHLESRDERPQIERRTEGGQTEVVLQNALSPGLTPDESVLLFVRETAGAQALWKKPLGDASPGCELISAGAFVGISAPRVSPDGKRAAFAGSGDPKSVRGTCGASAQAPLPAFDAPGVLKLAEWLGVAPSTAWAHGLPWNVWTINLDGTGLTRIADINEDEPQVAWAPDGTQIAAFGPSALQVMEAKPGGRVQKLVDQGGYGSLDWTK